MQARLNPSGPSPGGDASIHLPWDEECVSAQAMSMWVDALGAPAGYAVGMRARGGAGRPVRLCVGMRRAGGVRERRDSHAKSDVKRRNEP